MRPTPAVFVMVAPCKAEPAAPPETSQTSAPTTEVITKTSPQAMVAAPNPDEAMWIANLRARQTELVQQVLERHALTPGSVEVTFEDMVLRVRKDGKSCERQVPRGWVEAELVTNFDHTLDHCVRELTVP